MKYWKLIAFAALLPIIMGIGVFLLQKNMSTPQTLREETQTTNSVNKFDTNTIFSNQWYSSIYKNFPTQPLFAFPLAYKLTEDGVGFSLPTISKTPDTIYGSYIEDFSIGLGTQLQKPTIDKIGNWSIGLSMNDTTDNSIQFTLAHGIPSTTIKTNGKQLILKAKDPLVVYNNGVTKVDNTTITTDAFRIEIHGHSYSIVMPEKTAVQITEKKITITSTHVFVAILDKPENFALFKQHANTEITDTLVRWNIKDNRLETDYQFITNNNIPLIAVLPHHYEYLKETYKTLGTYETLRGKMYLLKADTITTSSPLITPDETFPKLQKTYPDFITALKEDQKKILSDTQQENGDYFLGAWYGKAASILLLLDAAGLEKEKQELLAYLEPKLLRSVNYLRYDANKKSVIADKPEFGNENLNDHHFHYGYFIRTAAILGYFDPSYKDKIQNHIQLLISDIASTDRTAKQFPFVRNFDVYEGHSWADGFANFGDGNNQESSSESIGAWYSVYLWAKATKDPELEATALYLYNSEIISTQYYWFGKNGMHTDAYAHPIASIVWGGKLDYSTWFSAKTNMKYGIQILPITPGSFSYLGTFENFSKYETDFYKNKGDIADEWGDLFVVFTSFYNPDKALVLQSQVKKMEANHPKSLFLYTLYRNKETPVTIKR